MIADQDRSQWFGASDVNYIVGNYDTKSFEKWWSEKEGLTRNNFTNDYLMAGTNYEHKILDFINEYMEKDKQIFIPHLRLRVNLDGNTDDTVYECKTFKNENGFKVPLKYKRQVWVQLFAIGYRKAELVAYGLTEREYQNWFMPIDSERILKFDIEPNDAFINDTFIPRLTFLCHCLDNGIFPTNERWEQWKLKQG